MLLHGHVLALVHSLTLLYEEYLFSTSKLNMLRLAVQVKNAFSEVSDSCA
jgi:hypothetical protein